MTIALIPIRCPQCRKKLGEGLEGTYLNQCPRCHSLVTVVREDGKTIRVAAISPVRVSAGGTAAMAFST
jgi:phage FluMu protein Com